MKSYTWILIIIIIIETGLLFFKSALNDILVAWYKHKKERKREERQDLRKTYDCLHRMLNELTMILIMYPAVENANGYKKMHIFETYQKPAMVKLRKLQDSLNEIRLRLPQKVRKIVDEAYNEMGRKLEETQFDSIQNLDKIRKRIEDITHKVADTMEQLLNYIDSY